LEVAFLSEYSNSLGNNTECRQPTGVPSPDDALPGMDWKKVDRGAVSSKHKRTDAASANV
jgi:hypothetical protein